ncbi:hypothetical protein KUCAC02_002871, partial [Chaenocephalus aceratus]
LYFASCAAGARSSTAAPVALTCLTAPSRLLWEKGGHASSRSSCERLRAQSVTALAAAVPCCRP